MSNIDHTSDLALPSSSSTGAGMNGAAAATTNGTTAITNGNAPDKDVVTTGGVSGIVPTLQYLPLLFASLFYQVSSKGLNLEKKHRCHCQP
jgi:hypothetical protein